jgi:hypothetical protein
MKILFRTAIKSQTVHDERHGPSRMFQYWRYERRANSFLRRPLVNSSLKNSKAAFPCSFQAHEYYRNLSLKRKADLLEELENEMKAGN